MISLLSRSFPSEAIIIIIIIIIITIIRCRQCAVLPALLRNGGNENGQKGNIPPIELWKATKREE